MNPELVKRVRDAMAALGITSFAELAQRIGVTRQAVSGIMCGRMLARPTIEKIAAALDIPVEDIIAGSNRRPGSRRRGTCVVNEEGEWAIRSGMVSRRIRRLSDLAEVTGIPKAAVGQMMTGRRVSKLSVAAVCAYFGLDPTAITNELTPHHEEAHS